MTFRVHSTIFVVDAPPVGRLSLVAYADQTIGIQLNGHPMDGFRWGVDKSELGLDAFREMTARIKSEQSRLNGDGSLQQLENAR